MRYFFCYGCGGYDDDDDDDDDDKMIRGNIVVMRSDYLYLYHLR